MIRSMTGYGSAAREFEGKEILVEIKSVNHRYSDISVRSPRTYAYLEDAVRRCVSDAVSRGKIDVGITINTAKASDQVVLLNRALAEQYIAAIKEIAAQYSLEETIPAVSVARFPDVLSVDKANDDAQKITECVIEVAKDAISALNDMRSAEGEKLREDMLERICSIEKSVLAVKERLPLITKEYKERLEAKIKEVLEGGAHDEQRVLTEVAIFADKVDTNEETVRLESHIAQMRQMLDEGDSIGRKLDFIIQEMNREINTIGSKSNDIVVAKVVIDVKAEIEKLREQAQNVE
ncbi:MAG: YicC/YloC family endoribonuclease [Clostridia bacterium]|nr:YicC/YloC family endoribonuclease [Clostridia bacterium]